MPGSCWPAAIAAAPDPARLAVSAIYAHLVMVAGIVATAVGDELVIAHPLGHTQPAWVAVILGGPALFLAGRARFEYAVFGRVSRDRPIGRARAGRPDTGDAPPAAAAGRPRRRRGPRRDRHIATRPAPADAHPSRRHHPASRKCHPRLETDEVPVGNY